MASLQTRTSDISYIGKYTLYNVILEDLIFFLDHNIDMTKGVLLLEIKKKKYHVIEGSLQIKSMIYLNSL